MRARSERRIGRIAVLTGDWIPARYEGIFRIRCRGVAAQGIVEVRRSGVSRTVGRLPPFRPMDVATISPQRLLQRLDQFGLQAGPARYRAHVEAFGLR